MKVNLDRLANKSASYWIKLNQKFLSDLFDFSSKNIQAYKKLLDQFHIDVTKINIKKEFKKLPITNKNYLKKNKFLDLLPMGDAGAIHTFSSTSGSSGEPIFVPRGEIQDSIYRFQAEFFLKNNFDIQNKTSLGIIGFGLGIWIGGIFTYKTFNQISIAGGHLALAPVGPNKEIFLNVLRKLGQSFNQVIIMGYPPFVKDLVDEGRARGIKWKKYNIKILTAAEAFPEDLRSYLAKVCSISNPQKNIINIYGSVELGTMAFESELSNVIRKIVCKNKRLAIELFGTYDRIPTLAQYFPNLIHFESYQNRLLASGNGSSFHLIRYDFPDEGGVIDYQDMMDKIISFRAEPSLSRHVFQSKIIKLPFVYIFDRANNSISLFGINIPSEYVKLAFFNQKIFRHVTGKFSLKVIRDKNLNQKLIIFIELRKKLVNKKNLSRDIQIVIIETLKKKSTEFQHLYNSGKDYRLRLRPIVRLLNFQDPEFFPAGVKHKWVIK